MFDANNIGDRRLSGLPSESEASPVKIYHHRYGDLSNHNAFIIKGLDRERYSYSENTPLYFHLSVTGRCQASCQGCINMAFNAAGSRGNDEGIFQDTDPVRDARCIANLIKENPDEPATICFYGGEPLLACAKMQAFMENIDNLNLPNDVRYMLYTNGDLLVKAAADYPEMLRSIWLYSVSIDGTRAQHERIRRGTSLSRIHAGLEAIKKIRQGLVLMWSTLREDQSLLDCFDEFIYLYDRGLADQFFWHWVETGQPFQNPAAYAEAYGADLHRIMAVYLARLKDGVLLPITHINELVLYLLSGRRRKSTACGVELARNYDIVGGRIHSCADLPIQYAIGTIDAEGRPRLTRPDLSRLTGYKHDLGCRKCGVHSYCGGRCPVQAVTGSMTRMAQYCQLMRLHVSIVAEYLAEIATALEKHHLNPQFIYDRSAYYAQFTDVTP